MNMPVHQNFICYDKKSAVELTRGNLIMTTCKNCGFVFNKASDKSLLSYGENYDNTQTHSPFFQKYISELISHLLGDKAVENCNIVEIGCGKGFFIRRLVAEGSGNTGIGFDPSYLGPLEDLNGKLRFKKQLYGPDYMDIEPDVVICRHVIEHIPDPLNMTTAIHSALSKSPKAQIFFETPCVEWILKNNVLWDFFYEHCSLFTKSSLKTVFELSGFEVKNVHHTFGGQYLWLEATPSKKFDTVFYNPGNVVNLAESFGKKEKELKEFWIEKLDALKKDGKVAVWGAGAKGVTLLNLADPQAERIDYVIDMNPRKQGKYAPGTGHEIISIKQIKSKGIKSIIVMNPNYVEENKAIIKNLNLRINWI